jgi:hypothetical protein
MMQLSLQQKKLIMQVYKAPENIPAHKQQAVFLAGTIDMGNSVDWQEQATQYLLNKNYVIYNPRRESWDSSWEQQITNPKFAEQVQWELDALDKADIIIMNLLPNSQSPISLLELGLHATSGKLKVCCPNAFWRSGNVQVVCNRYNIPLFTSMDALLETIQ